MYLLDHFNEPLRDVANVLDKSRKSVSKKKWEIRQNKNKVVKIVRKQDNKLKRSIL